MSLTPEPASSTGEGGGWGRGGLGWPFLPFRSMRPDLDLQAAAGGTASPDQFSHGAARGHMPCSPALPLCILLVIAFE